MEIIANTLFGLMVGITIFKIVKGLEEIVLYQSYKYLKSHILWFVWVIIYPIVRYEHLCMIESTWIDLSYLFLFIVSMIIGFLINLIIFKMRE